jgi:hypothetical protein
MAILEGKDDFQLEQVISQAQNWVSQSRDQARDVLLDEPILRFVLVQAMAILERRYRDYDLGTAVPRGRSDYTQRQTAPGYRQQPQSGQFFDFQGAPTSHHAAPPPMPQPHYAVYPQGPVYAPYDQYYGQYPPQAYYPGYAPPQYQQPPPGPDLEAFQRQVMSMSEEEIAQLPPETRAQVDMVRATIMRQGRG